MSNGIYKQLNSINLLLYFILVLTIFIYWFKIGYNSELIRGNFFNFTILTAIISGIYSVFRYDFLPERRIPNIFYSAALIFIFLGNLIMVNNFLIPQNFIQPKIISDILILTAYPLFLAGLLIELRKEKFVISKTYKILFFIISLVLAVFGAAILYYSYFYTPINSNTIENMIFALYGISDLVMILAILILATLIGFNQLSIYVSSWSYMLVAFIMFILADIVWSLFTDDYSYLIWPMRSVMDTLWIIGHLCFLLSFIKNNKSKIMPSRVNNTNQSL